jgi:hypothetical protein
MIGNGLLLVGVMDEMVPKLKSKSGMLCSLNVMGLPTRLRLFDGGGVSTVVVDSGAPGLDPSLREEADMFVDAEGGLS